MDYSANFQLALSFTLKEEGGYTVDQGGSTYCGIEQSEYDLWRQKNKLTPRDVRDMTNEECEAIYHENYWIPVHGDYVPFPICVCFFDAAVNCGVERAMGFLRQCLGLESQLSQFDSEISEAFWKDDDILHNNYLKFCHAFNSYRMTYYHYIASIFPDDAQGWYDRVDALSDFCVAHSQ